MFRWVEGQRASQRGFADKLPEERHSDRAFNIPGRAMNQFDPFLPLQNKCHTSIHLTGAICLPWAPEKTDGPLASAQIGSTPGSTQAVLLTRSRHTKCPRKVVCQPGRRHAPAFGQVDLVSSGHWVLLLVRKYLRKWFGMQTSWKHSKECRWVQNGSGAPVNTIHVSRIGFRHAKPGKIIQLSAIGWAGRQPQALTSIREGCLDSHQTGLELDAHSQTLTCCHTMAALGAGA